MWMQVWNCDPMQDEYWGQKGVKRGLIFVRLIHWNCNLGFSCYNSKMQPNEWYNLYCKRDNKKGKEKGKLFLWRFIGAYFLTSFSTFSFWGDFLILGHFKDWLKNKFKKKVIQKNCLTSMPAFATMCTRCCAL